VEPDRPTLLVILAAGGGTRYHADHHKLLAPIGEHTVIERAIGAAVASGAGPVLVVTGAIELPPTAHAPAEFVTTVHNPHWADGQATSLAAAVEFADRVGADAIVVGLGDQPFVTPEAWAAVAASRSPIAIATYDGRRRNPVRLHRSVWPLLPTTGDEGARTLTQMRPDLVEQVPCQGSPADIDTVEDLAQWQSRSSTNSP
jgi:CTP:molybdopterin cytidylyltransferase MocA